MSKQNSDAMLHNSPDALIKDISTLIDEEILKLERAEYGETIVISLSKHLALSDGKGYSRPNLFRMIKFAKAFPNRDIVSTLSRQLTWSHFVLICAIDDDLKRDFYAEMCRVQRWSVSALQKQLNGMLYERIALSKQPESVIKLQLDELKQTDEMTSELTFKDPYFLNFIKEHECQSEEDLENLILNNITDFLQELGTDFCFVARQKRMGTGKKDRYLDLLFFYRRLSRLIAIELKLGDFDPAYKGQMEWYLNWLDKNERFHHENKPMGIILCAGKDHDDIEYLEMDKTGIHVAQYLTERPPREILEAHLRKAMAIAKELDECAKYAMVTIFCHIRSALLADSLGDLFVKLVMKIEKSSENYVNKTLVKDIKRVEGKFDILYKLAETSLDHPDGVIKDTIYPVVDIETLQQLKEDLSQRGNWYKKQVRLKMRSLYSYGSRTELLDLLALLKFNARDEEDKALLAAVNFIIKHRNAPGDTYKGDNNVPLAYVVPKNWLDFVVENCEPSLNLTAVISIILQSKCNHNYYTAILPASCSLLSRYISLLQFHQQHPICNKLNYEMVICGEVRKKLSYKGIWIDEGYRYRDPKKDLPPDFEKNKAKYYQELGLPMDVSKFINHLKDEVSNALSSLNETILSNDKVTLSNKHGGHIKISPSLPQKLPENIVDLHNEIIKRWGHINLIDAFKEANIRIGFTRHLERVGKYSNLDTNHLVMRLLLSLYAIGSNTGLKRISIANPYANETELQYVKRRFINPTNVKLVIREVISMRNPTIFGKATTTVACDSKKLNAWDQNLMTEWHGRYRGHGVMVYWHVDTNALCIHSQSKTCTSSEVGAMIKGILEHSTKMDLKAAYVDTHGQSTIGFGIGKLLNFEILPRLKNIHKQKLYMVSDSDKQSYGNLTDILKDGIQWKSIETDYDEAVKHLVGLKTGLVEADVFIKRFSKDNYKHPAYKANCEIGKASKTKFLCKYLQQEDLRIEINAGLNIVERLNSVMNFFFYGKLGKISSNDPEEQELSILCLHVYINTLLIQEILSDPHWRNKLIPEDYRALSPLIHSHFNPYGTFLLDLAKRLMIGIEDFTHDRDQSNVSQRESETVNQAA